MGASGYRSTGGRWLRAMAWVVFLSLSACAGRATLQGSLEDLYSGRLAAADAALDRYGARVGSNDRLLYLLNGGVVKQLRGDFHGSNQLLERAEQRVEELLTHSISREAASFLVNDQTRPYEGASFEQTLINYYKAINYLLIGALDDALVECRRLDVRLHDLDGRLQAQGLYGQGAFLRYFTGLLFEAAGESGDAFVAYRNALDLYRHGDLPVPPDLAGAALRTARLMDFQEEEVAIVQDHPEAELHAGSSTAQIIVLIHTGRVPRKVSESVVLPTEQGFPVRLSLPSLVVDRGVGGPVAVTVAGYHQPATLVEEIDRVAARELAASRDRELARLVARAVTKEIIARQASKEGGEMAGLLVRMLNIATEVADTRSWESLPARVYLARLPVTPGAVTLEVEVAGRRVAAETIEVPEQGTVFRKLRVF